jgi:hypothetical protein
MDIDEIMFVSFGFQSNGRGISKVHTPKDVDQTCNKVAVSRQGQQSLPEINRTPSMRHEHGAGD